MDDHAPNPWICRLFGLEGPKINPWEKLLLLVALCLGVVAFLLSLQDVRRYSGIDFRNRIVGARVMLAGHDPYTFEWQPGMPLEYLDPVYDYIHRLTIAPTMLWFYAPIAHLPYRAQRILSCILEWAALIASMAVLVRLIPEHRHRILFLLGAVLFFILGDFWRIHVERGQVYAFHLLALSIGVSLAKRDHLQSWPAGVAFGVAALMRPTLLMIAPAFLVLGKWRTAVAAGLVWVAGSLATLPFMHPNSWKSYFSVGNQYYVTLWDPDSLPRRPKADYQGPIEGYDFEVHLREVESSSFAVFYAALHEQGRVPLLDLGVASKALLLADVAILCGVLLLGRRMLGRTGPASVDVTLLLIATMTLNGDYFLPHRWAYVDVVLLLPLALALPLMMDGRASGQVALLLVLIGLLVGLCLAPRIGLYQSTLTRSWMVMGAITALALWRFLKGEAKPPLAA